MPIETTGAALVADGECRVSIYNSDPGPDPRGYTVSFFSIFGPNSGKDLGQRSGGLPPGNTVTIAVPSGECIAAEAEVR
jgi:hypothetical protein